MYTVYILFSASYNEILTGTTEDLSKELLYHNSLATEGNIVKHRPWELFYFEEYEAEHDAAIRQQHLETKEGREYIWNMIENKPRIISVMPPAEEELNHELNPLNGY